MNESSIHERGHATESELDAMRDRRPTRWDALPERRLSTPYTRTHAPRFTVRWRDEQFNEDFEMGYLLGLLDSGGWTFIAYGPVHQESPHAMVFDVAALRANRICWEWMDQQNRSQTTRFTPLTDEFTDEAENFSLTFPQNRRTCPECE